LPFFCPFRAADIIEQPDFIPQVSGREVRVTHRHLHRLVAEELGNRSQ
jgi:hypothetical protein